VLFVSHNMVAVKNLCTNGLFLINGCVEKIGNINEIANHYLNYGENKTEEIIKKISNVKRSNGNGNYITEAWIENINNEATNKTMAGEPFTIKFRFNFNKEVPNVLFGFGIEDQDGHRITSLNNEIAGTGVYHSLKNGTASCTFYNPNIIDGTYWVSLSIVSNQVEWVDYVERAFTFNVEPKDVYGTGKLINQTQGKVFLHGKVEVV